MERGQEVNLRARATSAARLFYFHEFYFRANRSSAAFASWVNGASGAPWL
jgi:hypothetical protein